MKSTLFSELPISMESAEIPNDGPPTNITLTLGDAVLYEGPIADCPLYEPDTAAKAAARADWRSRFVTHFL